LDFDDDILFVEYEYFSCGFDIDESFDEDFYGEYESFSFDLIHIDFLFESYKSEFIKSDNLIVANFDLTQTLTPFEIRRLVDFDPLFYLDCSFMMMIISLG